MGRLRYHQAVYDFERACYDNGFVQSLDWPAWTAEGRRYISDPALVASARLATCIKLITASLRYERFCDGHLAILAKSSDQDTLPPSSEGSENWLLRVKNPNIDPFDSANRHLSDCALIRWASVPHNTLVRLAGQLYAFPGNHSTGTLSTLFFMSIKTGLS